MIQIRGADVCCCFNKRFAAQGQENRFFLFGCAPHEANSKVQSCNLPANNAEKFQSEGLLAIISSLTWVTARLLRTGKTAVCLNLRPCASYIVGHATCGLSPISRHRHSTPTVNFHQTRRVTQLLWLNSHSCSPFRLHMWADSCNSKGSFRIGIDSLPFLALGSSDSPERLLWTGSL